MGFPSYVDYQVKKSPSWLSDPVGVGWESSMGLAKNAVAQAATDAVTARFFGNASLSPADALAAAGRDRKLPQLTGETTDAYRARVVSVWSAYQWAGTAKGILDQLAVAGYSNVKIVENADYTGPGADASKWWRFWVKIYQPHDLGDGSTGRRWGDGWRWGDGTRWSGMPKDRVDLIKAIIRKWKPPHAQCVKVIVVLSGALWGDGWKWGDGTKWGGAVGTFVP